MEIKIIKINNSEYDVIIDGIVNKYDTKEKAAAFAAEYFIENADR